MGWVPVVSLSVVRPLLRAGVSWAVSRVPLGLVGAGPALGVPRLALASPPLASASLAVLPGGAAAPVGPGGRMRVERRGLVAVAAIGLAVSGMGGSWRRSGQAG